MSGNTNNETKTVDGKELYVPFVVTTGTMLPTNNASNVEVTNGKVISNGSSILSWRLQHQVYQKTTIIIKI